MNFEDIPGGERGKQEGMARADRGASPEWKAFTTIAIREVAIRKRCFTTDHVEIWRMEHNGPTTHEQRAYGPRMREAARLGIIEKSQDTDPSRLATCHRRPKCVWISKIYRGNQPPIRYRRRRPLDPNQYDLGPLFAGAKVEATAE